MGLYKLIKLKFINKPLILTPQFLLDYSFLNQVIVWDPDQTNAFGRKLESTMLKLMAMGKRFVVAYIQSKALEWRFKEEVYYAFQA